MSNGEAAFCCCCGVVITDQPVLAPMLLIIPGEEEEKYNVVICAVCGNDFSNPILAPVIESLTSVRIARLKNPGIRYTPR